MPSEHHKLIVSAWLRLRRLGVPEAVIQTIVDSCVHAGFCMAIEEYEKQERELEAKLAGAVKN